MGFDLLFLGGSFFFGKVGAISKIHPNIILKDDEVGFVLGARGVSKILARYCWCWWI